MGLISDANAIRAFFDIYNREIGLAELDYFLDVFGSNTEGKEIPFGPNAEYRRSSGIPFPSSPSPNTSSQNFNAQYRLSTRKWRRALRVANILKIFPWISGIAIANTLSFLSVKESSDIDLFITCKPKRVWLTRLCVVSFLRLFRLRPGEAASDPVCPTFFVDEAHLDLSVIALPEGDSYLLFWLATLAPVWGDALVWERFFAANTWALQRPVSALQPTRSLCVGILHRLLALGDSIVWENIAERMQRALMPKALRDAATLCDTRVVMGDGMLKFHENDRRAVYHRMWQDNYAKRTRMAEGAHSD